MRLLSFLLKPKAFFSLAIISLIPALYIVFNVLPKQEAPHTPISKINVSSIKNLLYPQTVYAAGVDYTKYTQAPYNLPAPNGDPDSDFNYNDSVAANLNTLGSAVAANQTYLTSKYDAKYVDPLLSVIWIGAIENTGADPYFWNCQEVNHDINKGCVGGFSSGEWQVGYGMQVSQAVDHLADDFNHAYGGAEDATKVQQIGQQVISGSNGKITNPSTFPTKNIPTLVSEAKNGNSDSQQAIAILLLDPKIGAITVALEVAGDIANKDDWKYTMEHWPDSGAKYYAPNMQNFSNRMKKIAENYTGQAGGSSTSTAGGGSFSLSLVLKPKGHDSYVLNMATANAIGGGNQGTGGGFGPGTVNPGGTSTASDVVNWAQKITTQLTPGEWGYYNNSNNIDICNGAYCVRQAPGNDPDLYWCTYLVVDAYNLAGHAGTTVDRQGDVANLSAFFKDDKSYKYVYYDNASGKTALPQVQPGFAFFLEQERGVHTDHEHTGIVQSIDLDSNGNGSITTLESNSDTISHVFTIANWVVVNTVANYPLTGFGGV